MLYKCNHCDREMSLMKDAKFCPVCGSEIKPVDLVKRIAECYNAGKTQAKTISEMKISDISYAQLVARAIQHGLIPVEKEIQTEYEEKINSIIRREDWDGKTKSIKSQVEDDCSYITINYYVYQYQDEQARQSFR